VSYQVEFTRPAARQFAGLPVDVQARLRPRIDALADNPRPQGVKKLVGEEELYRLRTGDYQIIYQVRDKVLLVLVVKIGHRRDIYRR
jgi:mRNA interferase RelE/StbE